MKTKYPIYIPSKARSNNCITPNNLYKYDFNSFKIVIEPQDYKKYKNYFNENNLLQLNKNDMGIAYVRQFIKNHSSNYSFHWQLDDDLRFKKRINNKNVPYNPIEMFCEVENYIDRHSNIGLAGLRNSVFAFSQKNDIAYNKQIASCVLVNTNTKCKYRKDTIEDTDYSMQILSEGYCTIIFNRLLYDNPPQGKVRGGNSVIHHSKITELQKNLVKTWDNCFQVEYLEGKSVPSRIKPSRIWQTFEQRPVLNG